MRKGEVKIEKQNEFGLEGVWQGRIEIRQKESIFFGFYNKSFSKKYLIAFNYGGEICLIKEDKDLLWFKLLERPDKAFVSNNGVVVVNDWLNKETGVLGGKFLAFDKGGSELFSSIFDVNLDSCAISLDGKYAITTTLGPDNSMYLIDTETGSILWKKDSYRLRDIRFSTDGKNILIFDSGLVLYTLNLDGELSAKDEEEKNQLALVRKRNKEESLRILQAFIKSSELRRIVKGLDKLTYNGIYVLEELLTKITPSLNEIYYAREEKIVQQKCKNVLRAIGSRFPWVFKEEINTISQYLYTENEKEKAWADSIVEGIGIELKILSSIGQEKTQSALKLCFNAEEELYRGRKTKSKELKKDHFRNALQLFDEIQQLIPQSRKILLRQADVLTKLGLDKAADEKMDLYHDLEPLPEDIRIKEEKKEYQRRPDVFEPQEEPKFIIQLEIYGMEPPTKEEHQSRIMYHKVSNFKIKDEPETALKLLNTAVNLDPKFEKYGPYWYKKGRVFQSLGQHEKAIQCFDKRIEVEGDYLSPSALAGKATSLMALSQFKEAMNILESLVDQAPTRTNSLNLLKCYNEILKIDPENSRVLEKKKLLLADKRKLFDQAKNEIKNSSLIDSIKNTAIQFVETIYDKTTLPRWKSSSILAAVCVYLASIHINAQLTKKSAAESVGAKSLPKKRIQELSKILGLPENPI